MKIYKVGLRVCGLLIAAFLFFCVSFNPDWINIVEGASTVPIPASESSLKLGLDLVQDRQQEPGRQ